MFVRHFSTSEYLLIAKTNVCASGQLPTLESVNNCTESCENLLFTAAIFVKISSDKVKLHLTRFMYYYLDKIIII